MQQQVINTIRHSLNAAQAALDLLGELNQDSARREEAVLNAVALVPAPVHEVLEAVHDTTQTVETPVVQPETPAVPSALDVILSELNHPRYTLRTLSELSNKTALSHEMIKDVLNEHDVNYVTMRRRSDGAPLIGLASRN